ncbi:hypothetical protein [Saccharothrix stipae]
MPDPIRGWVLDAPVIAGFARRDERAEAAVWLAVHHDDTLLLPSLALSLALGDPELDGREAQDALAVLMALAVVDDVDTARAYGIADVRARADQPGEPATDPGLLAVAHVVSVAADADSRSSPTARPASTRWTRVAR